MTLSNDIGRRSALGLGVAAGAAAITPRHARAQAKTVKVALLAPMSGAWARNGQMMKSGADMGIEEINNAGGVKSLGGAKMELVVVDAGDTTEKATNAAQRMIANNPDLVGGTGAWLSSFTLAVTEVTERAQLPWLTLSYSDAITNRGFRYVFQMSPTADRQAIESLPTFLKLAKNATGKEPQTIALVSDNTAAEVSFLKPIRATELDRYHLRAVADEVFTPPLSDATSIVQRVRSGRPDIMFQLSSSLPDTKLLMDKFSEYRLGNDRLPKMGAGGGWTAPEMVASIGKDIVQGAMAMIANWPGKGQEALEKRFMEQTKEPWLNQDSLMTYVDMMTFHAALEKAGAADRQKVADVIRNFDLHDEGPAKLIRTAT